MVERILVMNLTRMGDLIQSTPLLAGLKRNHPDASITLVVSSDFAEFSGHIPHIDEIIVFDLRQFKKEFAEGKSTWVEIYQYLKRFLDDLKQKDYDLMFNLSHSKLSALMITYMELKNVRGFGCHETGDRKTDHPWMQYFGIEPFNRSFNTYNLVDIFTRSGDVSPEGRGVHLKDSGRPSAEFMQRIKFHSMDENELVIGIQAGSSKEGRRWPPQAFASLADKVVETLNARVVLFGVASETPVAEEIIRAMKHGSRVIDLTGKTLIPELIEWVRRCGYLVTNDTGTMHIAAAVGTRILGLFFAHAHAVETGPYGPGHLVFQARISCAPCSYGVHCNNIVCIEKVTPDHLFQMIAHHQEHQCWQVPGELGDLEEMDVFETGFDQNHLYRLKPLIRRPCQAHDVVRLAYRIFWLDALSQTDPSRSLEEGVLEIRQGLFEDYDFNNRASLREELGAIASNFKTLSALGKLGAKLMNEIQSLLMQVPVQEQKIKEIGERVEQLDQQISQVGLTHPEVKPVADMHNKRKENQSGDDLRELTRSTLALYLLLQEESQRMGALLNQTAETLDSRSDLILTEGADFSIKAAVPGK